MDIYIYIYIYTYGGEAMGVEAPRDTRTFLSTVNDRIQIISEISKKLDALSTCWRERLEQFVEGYIA